MPVRHEVGTGVVREKRRGTPEQRPLRHGALNRALSGINSRMGAYAVGGPAKMASEP